MLKFFQSIRRNLLDEGRLRKYLVYAIGEILLVMIGILLALQVNNWNEKNQKDTQEIKLLTELKADLYLTKQKFLSEMEEINDVLTSKSVIIKIIEEEIPWHDSLQQYFNNFYFYIPPTLISTAYKSLENWGLANIESDTIRRQIVYLFQERASYLKSIENAEFNTYFGSRESLLSSTIDFNDRNNIRPVNYRLFLQNKEFANKEKFMKLMMEYNLRRRKEVLQDIDNLIINIENESP